MNYEQALELGREIKIQRDAHDAPFSIDVTNEHSGQWGVELIPDKDAENKYYWQVFHTEAAWEAYKWRIGWGAQR